MEKGSSMISFASPILPDNPLSIFLLSPGTKARIVSVPPWVDDDLTEFWADASNAESIVVKRFSLGGLSGTYSVVAEGRGEKPDPSRRSMEIASRPYAPKIGVGLAGRKGQFTIRNGGVVSLEIVKPGSGYAPSREGKPAMALYKLPGEYVAPFSGMVPVPEHYGDDYSFLNVCFATIVAVDRAGGILELRPDSPGCCYIGGSLVQVISGQFEDSTGSWVPFPGTGCTARVNVKQYITITRATQSSPLTAPVAIRAGDSVFLPQYGHGLPESDQTPFNSAPREAQFRIDYGSPTSAFSVVESGFPVGICEASERKRETGWRIIEAVVHPNNDQILSRSDTGPGRPASYLSRATGDLAVLFLTEGFDLSSFRGEYALTGLTFLNPSLRFRSSDLLSPRQFVGPVDVTPPIAVRLTHGASLNQLRILRFDDDTSVAMNYTGSWVSQNQMVCYQIELVSLILPNLPLSNFRGGLIAFYPYVYVELTNATAPSGGTPGILYSNNPNAKRALFKCAITNTPTPDISKFIKISGNGAVQTVKFKPNDALKFRVFLSDGSLFRTRQQDAAPPSFPVPAVQVSAQFAIKRAV